MNRANPFLLRATLPGLALLLLAGCGGGSSGPAAPPSATVLAYTNPALAGYSLQAEPATNHTSHLVLDLVGPSGAQVQGVSFFLTADPGMASWSQSGSAFATPGAALNLGLAPRAFITKVSAAGVLQVGIYQKSGAATLGPAPLVSVALDLRPGVSQGSTVALAATGGSAVFVDPNGVVQPFPAAIAVGGLTAN